jgi:hypothetical protein
MTAPRRAGFAWAAAGIALLGTVVSGPLALVVSASAPLLSVSIIAALKSERASITPLIEENVAE